MASGPRFSVKFKRRRQGKTDYKGRLALLKGKKTRVVVRKSSRNITIQFIQYLSRGDKVLGTANSSELKALGWKFSTGSIPAAYLTALLAAKRVGGRVREAILDIGMNRPKKGAKVFAALKGLIDGGIKIPYSEEVLPDEERLSGGHIEAHRKQPIKAAFEETKAAITALKEGVVDKKKKPKKAAPRPKLAPKKAPVVPPPKKPVVAKKEKPKDEMDDLLAEITGDAKKEDSKDEKEKEEEKKKKKSALEELLLKRGRKDLINKEE